MLTLKHFDLTPAFPKLLLEQEVIAISKSERLVYSRAQNEHTLYYLVSLDGVVVVGGQVEKGHRDGILQGVYTGISRTMSYVIGSTLNVEERLALVRECIELAHVINAMPEFTEERVKARLEQDPKAQDNPPMTENHDLALASEIWHVHPTFSESVGKGKFEDIKLTRMVLWGSEKIRYTWEVQRGRYSIEGFVDFELDEEYEEALNKELATFSEMLSIVTAHIPPTPETNEEDE